jgi:hypothetical protein
MSYDSRRTLLGVINIDAVEGLAWGGQDVTYATGDVLVPEGGFAIFEKEEAEAALYLVGDTDKTPEWKVFWISGS